MKYRCIDKNCLNCKYYDIGKCKAPLPLCILHVFQTPPVVRVIDRDKAKDCPYYERFIPKNTKYTLNDIGCYAYAENGHQKLRLQLAMILSQHTKRKNLIESLAHETPTIRTDEVDALYILNNELCDNEVYFDIVGNGDLMLLAIEK